MPAISEKQNTAATLVFKGTVQATKDSTVDNINVGPGTLIVTVDQVVEAPQSLAKLGGSQITVQLKTGQKAQPGQTMIFHTNGWIFGDSIAVQCISMEPVKRTHFGLLNRGGDPVEHRRNRIVQDRFNAADAVVSGVVSAVKLPDAPTFTRRSRSAVEQPELAGPVSEHNPHWRDAVITIDEKHKGNTQGQMVVRFPASTDVRWYKAPKFTPGQQGYFMLHKTKVTRPAKRRTRAAGGMGLAPEGPLESEEVYTALHPEDFQPYTDQGGIKRILNGPDAEPDI